MSECDNTCSTGEIGETGERERERERDRGRERERPRQRERERKEIERKKERGAEDVFMPNTDKDKRRQTVQFNIVTIKQIR